MNGGRPELRFTLRGEQRAFRYECDPMMGGYGGSQVDEPVESSRLSTSLDSAKAVHATDEAGLPEECAAELGRPW